MTTPCEWYASLIRLTTCPNNNTQVLKANFPGVKIETDVRTLKELPRETEILAAGFPCIDISRIGKQEGLDGEHSCLVYEVFRLLRKSAKNGSPVPWVIIENVSVIRSLAY